MSNNHVEIIGFDLGHGETALTKIVGEYPEPPKKLLLHEKEYQTTMIAYHPNDAEKALFGKPALNPRATGFQIAFKQRPTSSPNYQKVMRDFVKAIYDHLLETDQIKKDDQNHFFIGCPSAWTPTEIAEYQKLLNPSLRFVSIIPESLAALMQAKDSKMLTLEETKGNVLVIDVGSSTTDCTLVKAGKPDEKEGNDGIDLGAALIDKAILDYSLSQNKDQKEIESAFSKNPLHRHRCEFLCREAKEEYFCYLSEYTDADSSVPTKPYKIPGIGNFEPIVYKEIIERIVTQPLNDCLSKSKEILPDLQGVDLQKSWQENFYHFLMTTVRNKLAGKRVEINTIILTGSASKMDFIPEIVHKIFLNCKCTKDSEPGLCIAMGLARWGRHNINTIHFTNEVEQFLQNDLPKIVSGNIDSLRSKLTENLIDGLSNKVIKPILFDWRNRNGIYTLNGLESNIVSRSEDWLKGKEGKEAVTTAIQNWLKQDLEPKLNEKTNSICSKYGLKLNQLIPPSLNYNPNAENLKSGNVIIIDPTAMTAIVNWIIGIVVGFITLALATTGIGLIIGFFVAIMGQAFAGEIIKDSDIPKWLRGWVSDDKISKMTSDLKVTLKAKVEEGLKKEEEEALAKNSPTFSDEITNSVKDWLSKLVREQADSVKILIS
jgi:hypothetical protein